MADNLTSRLYVTLSASQVRKRLKSFGHGVKRIESTGKNQAVIHHTATGRSLKELQAKFSDVQTAATENALGIPVENLRHIGPATAASLKEVGIRTLADLVRVGAAAAYRRIQQPKTLTLLWALAAGLADKDVSDLSEDERERLLKEVGA